MAPGEPHSAPFTAEPCQQRNKAHSTPESPQNFLCQKWGNHVAAMEIPYPYTHKMNVVYKRLMKNPFQFTSGNMTKNYATNSFFSPRIWVDKKPLKQGIYNQTKWDEKEKLKNPTHSSVLAWRIPKQRSMVGLSPWGLKESDTTKWLKQQGNNGALEKEDD